MASHLRTELVLDALDAAVTQRRPRDVIHHSDQGSQGELNRSSQHLEGGCCDDQSKAAFGTIWAAAIVVTRSTASGRTR
jgi:transposase InsO family protein